MFLNLDGWFDALSATSLSNKFAIFDIPLLYCYTNLNSSIIYCLSSGGMYLFLGVALSTSTSVLSFGNSSVDFFETLVILSAILLPIKSPAASAVFWVPLFEGIFIASAVDFLALSKSFWPYLLPKFFPWF